MAAGQKPFREPFHGLTVENSHSLNLRVAVRRILTLERPITISKTLTQQRLTLCQFRRRKHPFGKGEVESFGEPWSPKGDEIQGSGVGVGDFADAR